jgi:MFS family permease
MFLMSSAVLAITPMIPSIQESHGYPVSSLGVIAGVSLLVGVATELMLGPQADRGHERIMLIASVVIAAISMFGAGASDSVIQLTFWRGLAGIAYGLFVPTASAIVIRSAQQGVGEGLARLQAAEFGGFAAGPFIGAALLARFGSTKGLEIAGIASLILLPVVLGVRLPAPVPPPAAADGTPVVEPKPSSLSLGLLRHKAVWVALILSVAVTAPVGTYSSMWAKFLADRGASAFVIAVSFAIFTLPFIVIAPFAGRIVDRVGPLKGSVWGTWIVAIVVLAYGLIGSVTVIILVSLIESVGQALAGPGTAAAMARASGPVRAGAGQGLSRGFGFLGAGLTAFVAAPIYAAWGARVLFGATAAMMIVLVMLGWALARVWAPELDGPGPAEPPEVEVVAAPANEP